MLLYRSGGVMWRSKEAMEISKRFELVEMGVPLDKISPGGKILASDLNYFMRIRQWQAERAAANASTGSTGPWKQVS